MLDTNSGAATSDDRQFHHFYAGFIDSFATEVEDPYPMFVGASSRATNLDPSASSTNITGLGECTTPPTNFQNGMWYYRSEDSAWLNVENSENVAAGIGQHVMWPMGNVRKITSTPANSSDLIAADGPVLFYDSIAKLDRAVSTRRLMNVPGSSPLMFPFPLTIISRANTNGSPSSTLDVVRGNLAGCFWVYNTDSAGATITAFALDYLTIGSDRYRVFHTHVQRQNYHYIAIKEDV